MPKKSINSNQNLALSIKERRNELNLTIEEAAKRAGVGTKTWSRYEAGEPIRQDKYKGVCKALNWKQLPDLEEEIDLSFNMDKEKQQPTWSRYLEENFGETAALSFTVGSDILLDEIIEEMEVISHLPKGSHLGQLDISLILDLLPQQFLTNYNYEFLYAMYTHLLNLRNLAENNKSIVAHSVLDEIILRSIMIESSCLLDSNNNLELEDDWKDWIYDVFDDSDIELYLYSNTYLDKDDEYHFDNWLSKQFYTK